MNCIEMLELISDGSIKYQDVLLPPTSWHTKANSKTASHSTAHEEGTTRKETSWKTRKRPIMETTSDEQVPAIPSQEDCVSSPSPVEQSVAKKVRASYTMKKKEEVVTYAKANSIYQASQHFGLSTGTTGP